MEKVSVLFCCMGNICRSPTAQGVFWRLVTEQGLEDRIWVDSAGTHAYHIGEPPDERAQAAALRRGVDLSDQRARRVEPRDFGEYDYVLAMDRDNFANLQAVCPAGMESRLYLFLDFSERHTGLDVPDPYYGGERGFEEVLDLVEAAAEGLLQTIKTRHFDAA
ncbi:MAG: low molecular weight phosphotyrosine protein phosphatase [Gammaproteobacteria bacterium]|jgi:protein-tyrosine phosphatase